jgi:hypothetical protein
MTMRRKTRSLLLAAGLLLGADPAAAETGAQVAMAGLRAPSDPDVNGLRFSLFYGENRSMNGLDLGFVSVSESDTLSGLALVFGVSKVDAAMTNGAAISLINFHSGTDRGLNAAFINKVNSVESGLVFGFVNVADGSTSVDIGGLNLADSSTAQVGFVNIAREIRGFQFGFINAAENGVLPVLPVFNFPKR